MTKPHSPNKIDEIGDELSDALSIKNLSDSEGGKMLIESLLVDIISAIDSIATGSVTLSHPALMALGIKAGERLSILRVLLSAKSNVDVLQQVLKETILAESNIESLDTVDPNHEAMIDQQGKPE